MANPIEDLRRALVGRKKPVSGEVLQVAGAVATIRTKRGVVQAAVGTGIILLKGDRVKIQDNAVLGKIQNQDELPVYIV